MPTLASVPRFHGDPPLFLASTLLTEAGLPHLFSTRHLPGVRPFRDPAGPFEPSALALFTHHGIGPAPVAFLRQIHGAEAIETDRGGLVGEADVVTTTRPALPLAIFSADCLPIIVYDPVDRRLAMAHAGWRGTVAGAARVAADRLIDAGGKPGAFWAAIGPSIGPCCYEVDEPVIDRLTAAFPRTWRDWVTPRGPGKWMLDLWRANEDQLRASGLDSGRIDNVRLCTACRRDLFHSYRRERGRGRLVAVAAIPDGPHGAC
jgi:YfiH family protein